MLGFEDWAYAIAGKVGGMMQLDRTWRRLLFVGALGLIVVLGGAACGGDDPTATSDQFRRHDGTFGHH